MLSRADMERLFGLLNDDLSGQGVTAELFLVGGAVMCLVHAVRPATRDVDAWFQPTRPVREAAARVGQSAGMSADWLNDAVKSYLSESGEFTCWLELDHLRIMVALPEYLLAMKCLAMRIGEEFHDLDDVRYLLRYLNITNYSQALEIVGRYYPQDKFPQKTLYALEELLTRAQ